MIKVSQREFQNKFFRLSKGIDKVYVYGRGGLVGIWTPAIAVQDDLVDVDEETGEIAVQKTVNAVQPFVQNAAFEKFKRVLPPMKSVEVPKIEDFEPGVVAKFCQKCHKNVVAGTYVEYDWQTGEEIEHELCVKCSSGLQLKH